MLGACNITCKALLERGGLLISGPKMQEADMCHCGRCDISFPNSSSRLRGIRYVLLQPIL
jgi:hypothetical protein